MIRQVLKSKIHRATITEANVDYEGSITIDEQLMDAADLVEFEKVLIANQDSLEYAFGDHAEVTVTRDKIEVEEYSHD